MQVFEVGGPTRTLPRTPFRAAMSLWLLWCLASLSATTAGILPPPDEWSSGSGYHDVLASMSRYRDDGKSAAIRTIEDPTVVEGPVIGYVDPLQTNTTTSDSATTGASDGILRRLRRSCARSDYVACAEGKVIEYVDRTLSSDSFQLTSAISVEASRTLHEAKVTAPGESSPDKSSQKNSELDPNRTETGRSRDDPQHHRDVDAEEVADHIIDRMESYARGHVVHVKLPELVREFGGDVSQPKLFGKNSFLAGFVLGLLAVGIKKLLLPFIIGAQIVKSILIAMFLPSILGSVGKLVGKGVTTFASSSANSGGFSGGSSGGNSVGTDNMEDFDFKDNNAANQYPDSASSGSELVPSYATLAAPPGGYNPLQTLQAQRPSASESQPLGTLPAMFQAATNAATNVLANKYQPKTSYAHRHQLTGNSLSDQGGSFYNRHKPHDFKTFQNIPTSSMLLTHYDPFYSPLLSRLDTVFHQLGYTTESCRERLVCAMYRNPAKFAPFSNLVSAQLSRELNELRKPSSDNPEILRFFRYMKAAKDGQDNRDCNIVHAACTLSDASQASPMAYTFQDINKLVQARRMSRKMGAETAPSQFQNDKTASSVSSSSESVHSERQQTTSFVAPEPSSSATPA